MSAFDHHDFQELLQKEAKALQHRYKAIPGRGAGRHSAKVGFALSGGGIRSATFALGVFQALAKLKLLRKIDYLSTVSGGGYFGAFLGRLFSRDDTALDAAGAPSKRTTVERVESLVGDPWSKPVAWLRENGRFLSPRGAGDIIRGVSVILRNWVAMHFVLASFVLMLFLILDVIRFGLLPHLEWICSAGVWLGCYSGGVWWSPYILVPAGLFILFSIPIGWAYWLVDEESEKPKRGKPFFFVVALFLVVLAATVTICATTDALTSNPACSLAAVLFLIATLFALATADLMMRTSESIAVSRRRLSTGLAGTLVLVVASFYVALVDSLGQTAYVVGFSHDVSLSRWFAALGGIIAVIVPMGRQITALLGGKADAKRVRLPLSILACLAGILLVTIVLIGLSAASHSFVWGWQCPGFECVKQLVTGLGGKFTCGVNTINVVSWPYLGIMLGITFVFSVSCRRLWPFLNRTTYQPLYSSRITRAFLGASNPRRLSDGGTSATEVVKGDALMLTDYAPHKHGGPLHLINVTINETVDGKSQIQQQDRKGVGMSIGPAGVSVGVRHHATWKQPGSKLNPPTFRPDTFQLFQVERQDACPQPTNEGDCASIQVEPLDLGHWIGISGAAFSTGVGARTSLGLSLLAGIFNIRLGQWWNSGMDPRHRHNQVTLPVSKQIGRFINWLFPVQIHLVDEFTARFHGTARRRWYLSDGGHFENMGAYELIRRRLPLIVICDGEQDAKYTFEGLANLTRKARTDLQAEIEFLDSDEVKKRLPPTLQSCFGSLNDLRKTGNDEAEQNSSKTSKAYAAIAEVKYDGSDKPASVILYLKPTLTGNEPVDLLSYAGDHPAFPHEPTSDQFFDEAQWESYRKLGEHMAEKVFQKIRLSTGQRDRQFVPNRFDPTPILTRNQQKKKAATK